MPRWLIRTAFIATCLIAWLGLSLAAIGLTTTASTKLRRQAPSRHPRSDLAGGTLITPAARLWVRRYIGPANDSPDNATALALSPDGSRVFVTGWSEGSTTVSDLDYATVAYSVA